MQALTFFLFALLIGYYVSRYISRPIERNGKLLPNRLPQIKIKNIEIWPSIRLHSRKNIYWIHHWIYLSLASVVLFVMYDSFSHLIALKGAVIGGAIQGLRYPDRFKFRHPRNLLHRKRNK